MTREIDLLHLVYRRHQGIEKKHTHTLTKKKKFKNMSTQKRKNLLNSLPDRIFIKKTGFELF